MSRDLEAVRRRRLRWLWRRARARRAVRAAELAYRRWRSPTNRAALERAAMTLRRIEARRPI